MYIQTMKQLCVIVTTVCVAVNEDAAISCLLI